MPSAKVSRETTARRQELQKQGLYQLREAVWQMRQVQDIEGVLSAIGALLTTREISFVAYSINLIQAPEGELPIQVYIHDPEGRQFQVALARDQIAARIIFESWQTKKTLYRPDLVKENRYGEHLQPESQHRPVRCAIDIPFSQGTLALASEWPRAYQGKEVSFLQEVAQVLEEGFLRLEDLRALQQALRREEAMGRVRSRIIAMRHLSEMGGEFEKAWVEELRSLGIPVNRVSLQRPAAAEGQFLCHKANFMTNARTGIGRLADCPWVKEVWESGKPIAVDRHGLDRARFNPEVQSLLEVPLPGEGSIGINSLRRDAFGPEAVRTVQLFAGLIAEGLQRLRDFEALNLAEQHLKLDVALQRVRNEILLMSGVEDWRKVVVAVEQQLKGVIVFKDCGINLLDRQHRRYLDYETDSGTVIEKTYDRLPRALALALDTGEPVYRRSRAEMDQFEDPIKAGINSVLDVPFAGGTVAVNSSEENAFGARDIQVLERFAQVLNEAHRRLVDLGALAAERQLAEEQLKLDLSLQQVRNQLLQIEGEGEWENVVLVFYNELQHLMEFEDCSLNLVDLQRGRMRRYIVDKSYEVVLRTVPLPMVVRKAMEEGASIYRPNRSHPLFDEELAWPINSVLDAPFSGGTVAINSPKEDAFSPRDIRILERFAQVLNEAHRRLEDLRSLALQKEQLHQAQKLEAIGQLATGVAHEINNPLTSVLGYSELLLRRDLDPQVRHHLETIHQEGERAREIAARLLQFVRRQKSSPQLLSLNLLVQEVLALVRQQFEVDHVQLVPELAGNLPLVPGHPGQVQQLLLSLLQNSREALKKAGHAGQVRVQSSAQDGWVRLVVEDDGPGIPEELRERIFEPFFTTKEVGKGVGSGMGLSLCFAIAREHGGRLWAAPRESGACLVLELPVAGGAVEPSATEEQRDAG